MIIYTVVGRIDYAGISGLVKSFINKSDASSLIKAIDDYDSQNHKRWTNEERKIYEDNHPAAPHSFCDSYDIEGHELVGGDA